ncbi:uncharacterized protein LOC135850009 [Planococcus citri]|uniref:uncharacterized protein LOC135850009 n=1 Tax=Planococcus citri TaxID=170843 RepID=UPI0031F9AA71
MLNVLIWIQTSLILLATLAIADEGCTFELNRNIPKSSLILKNQPTPQFLYPDQRNQIHIAKDAEIRISCADKYLDNVFYAKEVTAKCIKNDSIRIKYHILGKKDTQLDKLECKAKPQLASRSTGKRCYSNGVVNEIGYQLGKSFLKIFSICWDDFEEKTVYSWYETSKLHLGREEKIKNTAYEGSQSFSFPIADVYEFSYQKRLFTKILRSEDLADRYIANNNLFIIEKSPLVSKNEFIYGPEQIATFHYRNTAPLWSIFKDGNWAKVEKSVNEFIARAENKDKYGVATGTYDIATLPNLFKEEQPLYMFTDQYDNKYLPVPKYYWKILYDHSSKNGIVFVGLHNPFVQKEKLNEYVFCAQICDQAPWLKVDNVHQDRGYVFCCDMKEFLLVTKYENMFEV